MGTYTKRLSTSLDRLAKLEHPVPPPRLWTQIPCFLELADRGSPQNIENKEVPCKIFLNKELRAVSASAGSFRLKAARRGHDGDELKNDF
jgi:hypothetical protein